jgi:ComF family protein
VSKVLDFLLPTKCVLCEKLGAPMCSKCKTGFVQNPQSSQVLGVRGFSITEYDSEAALMVNAIKEKGLTSLIPTLADLIVESLPESFGPAVFVPVPSSKMNTKKRGFSHTTLLAKALARKVDGSSYRELLVSAKPRFDQVGLTGQERVSNMAGAFRADLRGFGPRGRQIVLIDDVLTSGASLSEAIRCLEASGQRPAGFCVFARAGAR